MLKSNETHFKCLEKPSHLGFLPPQSLSSSNTVSLTLTFLWMYNYEENWAEQHTIFACGGCVYPVSLKQILWLRWLWRALNIFSSRGKSETTILIGYPLFLHMGQLPILLISGDVLFLCPDRVLPAPFARPAPCTLQVLALPSPQLQLLLWCHCRLSGLVYSQTSPESGPPSCITCKSIVTS